MANDGITEVTSPSGGTFTEDTDYQEWNTSAGNTSTPHNAIDWSLGGSDPQDTEDFTVTYTIADDISIDSYEKSDAGQISTQVT